MEKPESSKGRFVPFKLKIDVTQDGIGIEVSTPCDMTETLEQREYMDSNIVKVLRFLSENYTSHVSEARASGNVTGEESDVYAELSKRVGKTLH